MLNSTSSTRPQSKKTSRPNSTSSSSTVTLKRAASLSSRSGSRTPHMKLRPPSPEHVEVYLASLTYATSEHGNTTQTKASQEQVDPVNGIKESMGNLNRWSHSTTSSTNSGQDALRGGRQKPGSTRRLSIGSSSPSRSLRSSPGDQSSPVKYGLVKSRYSPAKEDPRSASQRTVGGLSRPSLGTLQIPQSHVDEPDTPSTARATPLTSDVLTPSTFVTTPSDYFGDRWNSTSNMSQRETSDMGRRATQKSSSKPSRSLRTASSGEFAKTSRDSRIDVTTAQSAGFRSRVDGGGYVLRRGQNGQETGDTESGSSIQSDEDRIRKIKDRTQRTVLSRALAKANTAVLLDNAHNFEGAIEAYAEACQLLHQAMHRTSGEADKKKLETIRATYTDRIQELEQLEAAQQTANEKALPSRPRSDESLAPSSDTDSNEDIMVIDTTAATEITNRTFLPTFRERQCSAEQDLYRQSVSAYTVKNMNGSRSLPAVDGPSKPQSGSASPRREKINPLSRLGPPLEQQYIPPPLSPRRPPGSISEMQEKPNYRLSSQHICQQDPQHSRDTSTESTSWLDTIDESGGSSASSIHSRLSSLGLNLRHGYRIPDEIKAEYDAAMHAAVDAACEEEPESLEHHELCTSLTTEQSNAESAHETLQETKREVQLDHGQGRPYATAGSHDRQSSPGLEYLDDEAEEEERLLEEMTKGYVMDDFRFDRNSKSALPRQSDSSGFSGRTYGSSTGSSTAATSTSLATLVEASPAVLQQNLPPPPPYPPPVTALPRSSIPVTAPPLPAPSIPPPQPLSSMPPSIASPRSSLSSSAVGVRNRRLSGRNAKQLKIETSPKVPNVAQAPNAPSPRELPLSTPIPAILDEASSKDAPQGGISAAMIPLQASIPLEPTPITAIQLSTPTQHKAPETLAPISAQSRNRDNNLDDNLTSVPESPARNLSKAMAPPPSTLRKNMSSSSLNLRKLAVSGLEITDVSPMTPGSATFPTRVDSRTGNMSTAPILPIPNSSGVSTLAGAAGGMHLFEDHTKRPATPGAPSSHGSHAPLPLEPCPESFLLRPFWLMRCLYQTVAHPRGGYLSNKLFIPRDIWRVKNVKIKSVDEKVAQCDLLTAALQKLAKVDNLDADAVLEEMQSFETVLDQVRVTMQKKLGSDVGLHGSAALFKASPATEETGSLGEALSTKTGAVPGKSYMAASWRKLRSKSSGTPLIATVSPKDGSKDALSTSSLPMTSTTSSRTPKRSIQQVQCEGPHASYMGALARLSDAVQILGML